MARIIEGMRKCVGARVEVVVVARLVDAHSPEDDGGMVPVAANHAADVVDGHLLPFLVADMLPAGNLFKHQQADLVATIEEVAGLRIVGSADDIAMELLAQDVGILTLDAAPAWPGQQREMSDAGRVRAA